jgi:hypothetical protein
VVVEPHEIGQAGLGVVALSEQTLLVMDVVAEAQEPDVRRQSAGKPLAAVDEREPGAEQVHQPHRSVIDDSTVSRT